MVGFFVSSLWVGLLIFSRDSGADEIREGAWNFKETWCEWSAKIRALLLGRVSRPFSQARVYFTHQAIPAKN